MKMPNIVRCLAAAALVLALSGGALHAEPERSRGNANAGATPIDDGGKTFAAFHGKEGVKRIAIDTVDRVVRDPRIAHHFKGIDLLHLKSMLARQFCFVLGGPCNYSGRSMKNAHAGLGITDTDMGALVEALQAAMEAEGVPFPAQNRLLAKLAPQKPDIVER